MSMRSRTVIRTLAETLLLVLIGAAAGVLFNAVRDEGLPYDLRADQLLTESGAQIVSPGKARKLFEEGEYVFVDARETRLYLENHIEGALSLPTMRFDDLYGELGLWSGGQPLLVYGSSAEVPVADDLARRLLEMGEESVAIMVAGFEAWAARGYPTESGGDGVLDPEAVEDWDDAEEEPPTEGAVDQ